MNGSHRYTALKIALPFILGIVLALNKHFGFSPGFQLLIFSSGLTGLLVHFLFLRTMHTVRWLPGFFAAISLFMAATYLVSDNDREFNKKMHEIAEGPDEKICLCRIEESPSGDPGYINCTAMMLVMLDTGGQWRDADMKVRLTFANDSSCLGLRYGDVILVSAEFQMIREPGNPYVFNAKEYWRRKGIAFRAYLRQGSWSPTSKKDYNILRHYAEICKAKFLETLRRYHVEGKEFALVTALLIGEKEYLEPETIRQFSYAGAVHVLSVSGLHVGIMYVLVDRMLFFLKRGKRSRKLHYILIIAGIWAYALITGLPSSVVRASLMFSLVAAGNLVKRNTENFNIVALAAFLQLLINPFDIAQPGFQLSYLAVLGIFAFYNTFNGLIDSNNRAINWTWSVVAVSIAAQLATSPVAIYNFHLFPVYFILTNLIVVPLAGFITYFAVALLLAGSTGFYADWLAWPLKFSAGFMMDAVRQIQSWPGAVVNGIVIDKSQVILIYIAMIALFCFWVLFRRKWLFILVPAITACIIVSVSDTIERLNESRIVVYQVQGHQAIDFIHDRTAHFLCDAHLLQDSAKIAFQVQPNRINLKINEIITISDKIFNNEKSGAFWGEYPFFLFNGKRIVLIDKSWAQIHSSALLSCDLAVISDCRGVDLSGIMKMLHFDKAVIDSSVPDYQAAEIKQLLIPAGVACHSVKEQGAFVWRW